MNASSRPPGRLVSLALATSLALSSLSVVASAEPTKADIATAKVAIKEARSLREAGNHAAALPKFKAAYALVPTPLTGLELGKAHLAVGELVEARLIFGEVVALPASATENDEYKAARVESKELSTKLLERIPSLELIIKGVPAGATARVTIDDQEVPAASLASPRLLNPGKHVIKVSAGDMAERVVKLELVEGQAKKHQVILKPKADDASASEKDEPTSAAVKPTVGASGRSTNDSTPTNDGSTQRTIGLVIAGLGAGVVVAGGIVYVAGDSKYDTATARCIGDVCTREDYLAAQDGRSQARLGMVVAGLGVAALGAGLVVWLTAPSAKAPRTSVAVGPGMVSLGLTF